MDNTLSRKAEYHLLLSQCKCQVVDDFIARFAEEISQLAESMKTPTAHVERQLRLHLPQFTDKEIESFLAIPEDIHDIIEYRMQKRNFALQSYVPDTLSSLFSAEDKLQDFVPPSPRKRVKTLLPKGNPVTSKTRLAIEFKEVSKFSKNIIENNLHYLQSPRPDSVLEYGLFIKGASYPFCYASFSLCDRMYLFRAINKTLWEEANRTNPYGRDQYIQLTRVYGMPGIPKNSISKLVSLASRRIHEKLNRYEIMITAINPYLGFSGNSMRASGFLPFATAPVSYNYDVDGEYKSRRQDSKTDAAVLKTPRNILLMRARDKHSLKPIRKRGPIYKIRKLDHTSISNEDKTEAYQPINAEQITLLQQTLASAWGTDTRYPRSRYGSDDPPSKGQCGVSSFYVGRELEDKGYDVHYCEGNAFFPDPDNWILHHCWLEITQTADTNSIAKTFIIDVTADQNGYENALIFEDVATLRSKGIRYSTASKKRPKHVKVDSLWKRLNRLEEKISKIEDLEDA